VDISVAVATPKGLVVPVLRNCENMGFADIERNIALLAERARDGKLSIEEMTGMYINLRKICEARFRVV
tara:strand:- start:602 stop:808 length:207 start_codon:yes stop_codon:yes gene_type:complete